MHPEAAVNKEQTDGEEAARNFKAVMSWWQEMAQQNNKCTSKKTSSSPKWSFTGRRSYDTRKENAAIVIQSHFRQSLQHCKYLRIKNAVCILQAAIRAWLRVKKEPSIQFFGSQIYLASLHGTRSRSENLEKLAAFVVDRRAFLKSRRSVIIIQRATRNWISRKRVTGNALPQDLFTWTLIDAEQYAATTIQSYCRGRLMRKNFVDLKQAAVKIQSIFRSAICSRNFQSYKQVTLSASIIQSYVRRWIAQREVYRHKCQIVMIQSHCRGWLTRKQLLIEKEAVIRIQSAVRSMKYRKAFLHQRHATLEIQRFARGAITRKRLLGASCYRNISKMGYQALELKCLLQAVLKLQRWWRGKLLHRQRTKAAAVIQSHVQGWIARQSASRNKQSLILQAALKVQRWWRGKLLHKQRTEAAVLIQWHVRGWSAQQTASRNKHRILQAVLNLQRWWKGKLLHKQRTKAAVVIQSHLRGWIARQSASRNKHRIAVIQAYMKGYLARKDLRGQLLDLRLRVQKSAANVDDGKRIINRLVTALSELLNMRSVSSILHICATLNMATQHSQKCCEELVAADAVGTLLKLIRSVSRSIPDQEVLKHALSTLRNLSRYPHLIDVLIECSGSVETILWEFLRNKEEGYFIASNLLKTIFREKKGIEAVHKLPALLKRLHNHVEELSRKARADKRTTQPQALKELMEKRLREAIEILELIKVSNGHPTRRLSYKV